MPIPPTIRPKISRKTTGRMTAISTRVPPSRRDVVLRSMVVPSAKEEEGFFRASRVVRVRLGGRGGRPGSHCGASGATRVCTVDDRLTVLGTPGNLVSDVNV